MTRALHVILMVLVVGSLPVLGAAGSVVGDVDPADHPSALGGHHEPAYSTDPVSEPDLALSARLDLPTDQPVASGTGSTAVDVASLVLADSDRFESSYRSYLLEERLERAESDSERRVVLRETLTEYEGLIIELRQREHGIARSYRDGNVTERELLNELGSIQMRAMALERAIVELDRNADETPGITLSTETGILLAEIETIQGPVRAQIVSALEGDTSRVPIHVATGEDGVILAMLKDDRFVREAIRFDNWDPSGSPQLADLTEAIQRTETLYPWAFADERGSRSYGEASAAAYRGSSEFVEGTIRVYLDRSSGNVYREYQTLQVERIQTLVVANETNEELGMQVDRTYPGGPMRISLYEPATGDPVNGSISLDDRMIGWSGGDGTYWTIAPRESTTVTGSAGLSSVSVEYSPEPNRSGSVETLTERSVDVIPP